MGQIYSFGDINMVVAALRAVAMILGSFAYQGGSLIILAFLTRPIFKILPFMGGEAN
jgi:hypothetical protein